MVWRNGRVVVVPPEGSGPASSPTTRWRGLPVLTVWAPAWARPPPDCRHACYGAGVAQLTIRLPDSTAEELREVAKARGQSVNSWVTAVLQAAVDPELSGNDAERTRNRLARAGLLAVPRRPGPVVRPTASAVAKARSAAGRGTPLSTLVSDGR